MQTHQQRAPVRTSMYKIGELQFGQRSAPNHSQPDISEILVKPNDKKIQRYHSVCPLGPNQWRRESTRESTGTAYCSAVVLPRVWPSVSVASEAKAVAGCTFSRWGLYIFRKFLE